MEEEWMRDRARLRELLFRFPHWRLQEYAQALDRSIGWIKKWRRRLRQADPHDPNVLLSSSRAHHAHLYVQRLLGGSLFPSMGRGDTRSMPG